MCRTRCRRRFYRRMEVRISNRNRERVESVLEFCVCCKRKFRIQRDRFPAVQSDLGKCVYFSKIHFSQNENTVPGQLVVGGFSGRSSAGSRSPGSSGFLTPAAFSSGLGSAAPDGGGGGGFSGFLADSSSSFSAGFPSLADGAFSGPVRFSTFLSTGCVPAVPLAAFPSGGDASATVTVDPDPGGGGASVFSGDFGPDGVSGSAAGRSIRDRRSLLAANMASSCFT